MGLVDNDLALIAADLQSFAGRIRSLSRREPQRGLRTFKLDDILKHSAELAAAARREHELRRMREAYVACEHFGEPAWDMMLDIFASTLLGEPVYVTSACVASHAPPTTALRYIDLMIAEGLLIRTDDPKDGRRRLLRMSDLAVANIGSYFMAIGGYSAGPGVGEFPNAI